MFSNIFNSSNGFENVFNMSSNKRNNNRKAQRSKNIVKDIEVKLEDIYCKKEFNVSFEKNIICKKCGINRNSIFKNNSKYNTLLKCTKHSKKGIMICSDCEGSKGNKYCDHHWVFNLLFCYPISFYNLL